ncbi:hypothetical protein LTS18_003033 [Coniosporium uncinatum]|uniref:Uncharacterized protein n=1 Tax=Coniosporium uncinatum TaxID=93489 RepID=A0ACC3D7G9_9PEZI|nr:hypothetical protein LTS18_003033 [Coniosporium uncinatum]
MRPPPQKPLIAIIGATGTGKSQLAVELATQFNGEVINGDAMQLYEGLPIITNKITPEERKGVPHHLLGCIGLEEPTWTVGRFVKQALSVIDEIHARGKLPILVGGTHYYTQSLLFKGALAEGAEGAEEDARSEYADKEYAILEEPTETILAKLKEIDPVMADRWHPNDRRKIQRSLEIWLKTGKTAFQTYQEQQAAKLSSDVVTGGTMKPDEAGSRLRFPTLLLWVHAENDRLRSRLDMRVCKMVDQGLLAEVQTLNKFLQGEQDAGRHVDKTRGIWVSIGYKEFEAYHNALNAGEVANSGLDQLKATAVEQIQTATRQYAKRQVRWIRIKLMHALSDAGATNNLYLLDGTDLQNWDTTVSGPARHLTEHLLLGQDMPTSTGLSAAADRLLTPRREFDMSQRPDLWVRRTCEACAAVFVTESDWMQHVRSKKHKRASARKKKATLEAEGIDGRGHGKSVLGD